MNKTSDNSQTHTLRPQNREEREVVSICFHDQHIASLFANLLSARGVANQIIETLEDSPSGTRIITEPALFEDLPDPANHPCLLVGSDGTKLPAAIIPLPQPLTENKIESALRQLLRQDHSSSQK